MKSYKDLDIYNDAFDLATKTHVLSLKLPKFELYEIGSQLRRSSQSIKDNIVEGYGRRSYKQDFIKFLVYAQASQLEALSQLQMIEALYPDIEMDGLISSNEQLGKRLYTFIEWVRKNWKV